MVRIGSSLVMEGGVELGEGQLFFAMVFVSFLAPSFFSPPLLSPNYSSSSSLFYF